MFTIESSWITMFDGFNHQIFPKTSTFIMKTLEFHSEKSQAFHKKSWLNYEMFHFPWPNSDGESISLGGLNSRQDGIRSNPGAAATGRTWRMDETIWVAKMGWVAYLYFLCWWVCLMKFNPIFYTEIPVVWSKPHFLPWWFVDPLLRV